MSVGVDPVAASGHPNDVARPAVRVLRIVTRMNLGGPAHHVNVLSAWLGPQYDTLLVTGRVDPGEAETAPPPGVRVEVLDQLAREPHPVRDIAALVRLIGIIRRFRPDIVHTHTAKAGFLGRIAAAVALHPRPIVVHTYEGHVLQGYFGPLKSRVYRTLERLTARVSDALVGVSGATVAELVALGVDRRAKFRVVLPGLDLQPFLRVDRGAGEAFRLEAGASAADVVVTYVGRLVPIKQVDVAVRAVAAARARGVPVRLAVVGDGPLRAELEALATSLGVDDAVRFFGYRRDTASIAAATDVALLTSGQEGLSIWLIEASAAGLPAVASAVGGIPELLPPGCGIVTPAGDVDAVADALEQLALDPELRRKLGARAREHVVPRFSAERLVRDVDELYRELLARARAAA